MIRPAAVKQRRRRAKGIQLKSSGSADLRSVARTAVPVKASLKARTLALLDREIAYIHNPSFRRSEAVRSYLQDDPVAVPAGRVMEPPAGIPAYFAELYATPLLTADQEMRLFRCMNCLKFRANTLRSELDLRRPAATVVTRIESLLRQATDVRERIVTANLRLVVSIARRFADQNNEFEDLVSDGNLTLMKAVEKFDYARGFRFSTYATHAIQRDFFRQIRKRRNDLARCLRGVDDFVAETADERESKAAATEHFRRYAKLLSLIDRELDEREQFVLAMRFGLDHDEGPQTLQVIGKQLGVSKERVRQLEIRALQTLQRVAGSDRAP